MRAVVFADTTHVRCGDVHWSGMKDALRLSHALSLLLRHTLLRSSVLCIISAALERRALAKINTEPLQDGTSYSCTSTIISISTGMCIGNCCMPTAERACRPWSP